MSNRKKINQFCDKNGIKILKLKYERRMSYTFGSGHDDSVWVGTFLIHGVEVHDEGYNADNLIENIQSWLDDDTFIELGKARNIIKNLTEWFNWPDVVSAFQLQVLHGWDKPEVSKKAQVIWEEATEFIKE